MWLLLHGMLLLPAIIIALPTHHLGKSAAVSASFDTAATNPLLSFENGNVGVNFLGYHASAGLGGLLTGDAARGGLHAEAGTPHGQSAGAGLGGAVGGGGKSAGGLYAGATAGGGVAAGAGLAGSSSASGAIGGSYAGGTSGGAETYITKITHKAPAPVVASGKFTASVAAPVVHKEVEIVEEQPKPQTTYIERTVIPNYVEKTVQVPTYVEKTIRVPTTVEKKIRVPAEPTIIEKTVAAPAEVGVRGSFQGEVVKEEVVPHTVTYVQKTRVHGHHHPHLHSRIRYKNVGYGGGGYGGGGYGGGFAGGFGSSFGGGYGGGYGGGFGGGGGGGGGAASGSYTVSKTAHSGLFDDIFNIPISTLGAVNKLVNGVAGGGSVSVSKSFGVGGAAY